MRVREQPRAMDQVSQPSSMSAGPVEMMNDGVLPPAHIQTTEGISAPTLANDT
jgi:hypothetical protein